MSFSSTHVSSAGSRKKTANRNEDNGSGRVPGS